MSRERDNARLDMAGLPTLLVIPVLLAVTDRLTEANTARVLNSEKRNFHGRKSQSLQQSPCTRSATCLRVVPCVVNICFDRTRLWPLPEELIIGLTTGIDICNRCVKAALSDARHREVAKPSSSAANRRILSIHSDCAARAARNDSETF